VSKLTCCLRLLICTLLVLTSASKAAPAISVGSVPAAFPSYIPALVPDTFLVPVVVSGAVGVQTFQFDLIFDNSVVEEVDPGDGSSGIYGAQFTAGNVSSMSFILGGFPFNAFGVVDDVAGSYPSLLNDAGVSGDGVLAYILFAFLPGQENRSPDFAIQAGSTTSLPVPEPSTAALLAAASLFAVLSTLRSPRHIRRRRPALTALR
jgi:hypothetical protein